MTQSIESMEGDFSEQPVSCREWGSADPPISRLRALEVALMHAEYVIGGRGGPGLRMRAEHILKHARQHNLDGRLYAIAWSIERNTRPAT